MHQILRDSIFFFFFFVGCEAGHSHLEKELHFYHVLLSRNMNNKKKKNWFGNISFNLFLSALGTEIHTDDVSKNSLNILG